MLCWRRRCPERGEDERKDRWCTHRVWIVQCSERVLHGLVEGLRGDGGDLLETGGVHAGDKVGRGARELLIADGKTPL